MINIVTGASETVLSGVEEFVSNHPHGNFFQSVKALRFFQSVDHYDPILMVALDGKQIVGSLLAVVIREGGGLKGYFSRRCIVWGGPLVKDENPRTYSNILKKLNTIANQCAIYSQFRNFHDLTAVKTCFTDQNWHFEEHLNIIIDLLKNEDDLWKDVHSKRRNEIRRAEKEGTGFRIVDDKSELEVTYRILKEVYDRARLPLPGFKFFESAHARLAPRNFKIFAAVNENRIIGTMYVLCFKGIMYDWYAGAHQASYKKYPNDLIPWKAFLWGKENDFTKFDFGGAGKPGIPYGVRDYKKKFGGEFVNYGRFEKVHHPVLFEIGKLGLKIWQKLK